MSEQLRALLDVTNRLDRAEIRYMISGSTAMNFYTRPRMTRDVDIVVELIERDIPALVGLLCDDFYIDDEAVSIAVANRTMFNVLHEATMTKVDFIIRKDERYREVEFSRRRTILVRGTSLQSVSPEDLILSKLVWSQDSPSGQQTEDVRMLLTIADLDREYLDTWAAELGVIARLDQLRS